MNELPDPMQQLLQAPAPEDTSSLRRRLRDETSRVVRRHRWFRLGAQAAAAVAAVLAIVAVGYLVNGSRRQPQPETPPVVDAPKPAAPKPEVAVAEETSPLDLEWRAFDSQTNRAATYFLAGNKYLEANQDIESALRCYSQALDACNPDQLEIAPEDNWLVVTLKNARRKERTHE